MDSQAMRRCLGTLLLGLLIGLTSHANAQSFPDPIGIGALPTASHIALFYQKDVAITPFVFPAATGGSGTLTYSLDGFEPLGFAFDPATRTLSGTPILAGAGVSGTAFILTYAANDPGGGSAPLNVLIVLCEDTAIPAGTTACTAPAFRDLGITPPADQDYTAGTAITPLTLSAATGGTGTDPTLVYTLTGVSGEALPDGLTFNPATRTLSGTPTTVAPATMLSYGVTDASSQRSIARRFAVTVALGSLVLPDPADQIFMADTATSLVLPAATGGGAVSYTLTGASGGPLPDGLSFDAGTRTLSGTPTTVATAVTLVYTVTRSDDSTTAMQTFTVAVGIGPLALPDPADQSGPADTAIIDRILPEATGGGTLSYTLTGSSGGALPSGLTFNPATRTLSGTPTVVGGTSLTYTVTRSEDNATEMQTFTVTVTVPPLTFPAQVGVGNEPLESTFINLFYQKDVAITPLVLPAATGGVGTRTYSLTGDLESLGFAFDPATRTLSGTPIVVGSGPDSDLGFEGVYEASDEAGAFAQLNVFITLCEDTAVPAGNVACTAPAYNLLSITTPADQTYTVGTAITPLTLPAATGGTGSDPVLVYSLTNVPDGLTFNPATRTLSGTPTTVAPATMLTYRVEDASSKRSIARMFTVTVFGPLVLPNPGNQAYTVGTAIDLVLPAATGGGTLSYTLIGAFNGEPPPWLNYDAGTRTLSGTPTTVGVTTLFHSVTRSSGSDRLTNNQMFTITVTAPLPLVFPSAVGIGTRPESNFIKLFYNKGEAITPLVFPAAMGGNGTLTYSLTGDAGTLGLAIDASTHTLSGTPIVAGGGLGDIGFKLAYTVDDQDSMSTSVSVFITVCETGAVPAGNVVCTAPTYSPLGITTPADQTYTVGTAITDLVLPAATGGTGTDPLLVYSLTNVAGLTFTASTRTLSGTPTTAAVATLTYGVTDVSSRRSITITFTVTVNSVPTGLPTITGTATQNQTLTAVTADIADADGLGAFSYQWKANDVDISGATSATFDLTQAQVDETITVTVSYTDDQNTLETLTSAATTAVVDVNDPAGGSVRINGIGKQGQPLTVVTTGITDLDGVPAIFTYQWNVAGGTAIAGATERIFIQTKAQVGQALTVTVSFTDLGGFNESLTSGATGVVLNNAPTISGTPPPTAT